MFGMLRAGSGQGAEAEDADVMAAGPLRVRQCAINHRVTGDVVLAVRAKRGSQPDIVHTWQKAKRGPRPVGWRYLARLHDKDAWIIRLGFTDYSWVGKQGNRVNRRTLVAHAGVLPVHLTIDIDGHKAGLIESNINPAVLDGASGRFALGMPRGSANWLAVDACDFDLYRVGGFKIDVGVGPAARWSK